MLSYDWTNIKVMCVLSTSPLLVSCSTLGLPSSAGICSSLPLPCQSPICLGWSSWLTGLPLPLFFPPNILPNTIRITFLVELCLLMGCCALVLKGNLSLLHSDKSNLQLNFLPFLFGNCPLGVHSSRHWSLLFPRRQHKLFSALTFT